MQAHTSWLEELLCGDWGLGKGMGASKTVEGGGHVL